MQHALKELKAALWRTTLITMTIALIALMVTFLSALTQGLGYQSISALKEAAQDDAIVISDTSSTLAGSRLDGNQITELTNVGATPLTIARTRTDNGTEVLMNWERDTPPPNEQTYLDHQPVTWTEQTEIIEHGGQTISTILPSENISQAQSIQGISILEGGDRWNVSASYAGEQLSLTLMIVMLYLVSLLVVGAFFVVWTLQRLHTVAVSSALGAARRVLIIQALIQALTVTVAGVLLGAVGTMGLTALIGEALPAVISFSTIGVPSILVTVAALIGASLSLVPILRIDPRQALETV